MKRMLASGFGDIYELGRVFRSGEKGRYHNPEFTMLEWYRTGMAYLDLASEVGSLIRFCGNGQFDDWPQQKSVTGICSSPIPALTPSVVAKRIYHPLQRNGAFWPGHCSNRNGWTCCSDEVIEPALPGETITIVYDFLPNRQHWPGYGQDDPPVAERFEVYLGQVELANGYQELTDANEQLHRFERERKQRDARGEDVAPLDLQLIEAMRHGLPECSGVALGVDRLLMAILKLEQMDSVLAFSADRC